MGCIILLLGSLAVGVLIASGISLYVLEINWTSFAVGFFAASSIATIIVLHLEHRAFRMWIGQ